MPWQAWPHALARAGRRGSARLRGQACRPDPLRALPAMARGPPVRRRRPRRARSSGLAFGFFRDLAVGAAPDGAEVWANPSAFARGVAIGAPPDPFSSGGQNWNLPPPNPRSAPRLRWRRIRRIARRQHAPCGCAADRSRDGAVAALLDPGRRHRGRRRLCRSIRSTFSSACSRPRAFAPAASSSAKTWARCRRACAKGLAAADVLSYRVLWFEREGTSLRPACALSGAGRGDRVDARPAHDRRMVERRRHRRKGRARPHRRRRALRLRQPSAPRRSGRSAMRSWRRASPTARRSLARRAARRRDHGGHPSVRGRGGLGSRAAPGRRSCRRNDGAQPARHRPRTPQLAPEGARRGRSAVADAGRAPRAFRVQRN